MMDGHPDAVAASDRTEAAAPRRAPALLGSDVDRPLIGNRPFSRLHIGGRARSGEPSGPIRRSLRRRTPIRPSLLTMYARNSAR
jgi:hypothetical protein